MLIPQADPLVAIYDLPNSVATTKYYDARYDDVLTGSTVMVGVVFKNQSVLFSSNSKPTKTGHFWTWMRVPVSSLPERHPLRNQ